jgi:hypothetical protein
MNRKQLALVATVCGVVVFVGVLLPWVTVNAGPLTMSENGMSKGFDLGIVILLLGIVGAAAAGLAWSDNTKALPLPAGQQILIGTIALALAAVLTFANFAKDFGPTVQGMGASRGIGLYLTLLAAVGGTVAMALLLKKRAE